MIGLALKLVKKLTDIYFNFFSAEKNDDSCDTNEVQGKSPISL